MVILDLKVDKFYAFKKFHVNFSYPKKIVGNRIKTGGKLHYIGNDNARIKKNESNSNRSGRLCRL